MSAAATSPPIRNSFLTNDPIIQHGDLVVVYFNPHTLRYFQFLFLSMRLLFHCSLQSLSYIRPKPGGIYNCKYGSFKHDDFLGKEFGSKVNFSPSISHHSHLCHIIVTFSLSMLMSGEQCAWRRLAVRAAPDAGAVVAMPRPQDSDSLL